MSKKFSVTQIETAIYKVMKEFDSKNPILKKQITEEKFRDYMLALGYQYAVNNFVEPEDRKFVFLPDVWNPKTISDEIIPEIWEAVLNAYKKL